MAVIMLDLGIVFIVYCLGFAMGFGTCARYIKDDEEGEDD